MKLNFDFYGVVSSDKLFIKRKQVCSRYFFIYEVVVTMDTLVRK